VHPRRDVSRGAALASSPYPQVGWIEATSSRALRVNFSLKVKVLRGNKTVTYCITAAVQVQEDRGSISLTYNDRLDQLIAAQIVEINRSQVAAATEQRLPLLDHQVGQ
jgi:hypothetical protein